MQVTDEMVMAHAVEDAKFAGKPFDTLGRADRARYLQRSRLCLQAAADLVDVPAASRNVSTRDIARNI